MFYFLKHPSVQKMLNNYPIVLDSKNPKHVFIFRRLIEWSMTHGRFSGHVGVS
jgi:hypothetical protein